MIDKLKQQLKMYDKKDRDAFIKELKALAYGWPPTDVISSRKIEILTRKLSEEKLKLLVSILEDLNENS